jgi:DNA-binding NarL/FixJ family response regulator
MRTSQRNLHHQLLRSGVLIFPQSGLPRGLRHPDWPGLNRLASAPGELGYIIAAEAARIDGALEALRTGEFDLAILDINVGGKAISPVAEALAARGTPFVLTTGQAERDLPELYRDRPILAKPFRLDSLERMLQSVTDSK